MNKFASDLAWTYGALAVMAASGLLINLVVGVAFGVQGLGAFNQALALFVIVSQLSAMGFHLFVFKSVAEFSPDRDAVRSIVSSALVPSVVNGVIFSTLLFVLAEPIGQVLNSPAAAESLRRFAPALLLFNINKILLSTLNAHQRMRAHAEGQVIRYASMLLTVLCAGAFGTDAADAAYCLLVSELALLAFLIPTAGGLVKPSFAMVRLERLRECLIFGVKGFWGGMAAELSVRTDVLVIGLFLSDTQVGIYALASVAYEGVINALYAVRLNLNPMLVGILRTRDWAALHRDIAKVARWVYPVAIVGYALTAILFLPAVSLIFGDSAFAEGYAPLLILLAPLVLFAGLLPFDQMLLQAGYAGHYSATLAMTFVVNLGLNLLLVPVWGLIGAAIATSLSLLASIVYFMYMAKRILHWNAAACLLGRLRGSLSGMRK